MSKETLNENITIEDPTAFSQSKIWQYQEDYFRELGIQAWVFGVPYYVTSNALIANGYAQMTLRYLQDGLANGQINPKHPIYMCELGTGPGKFSFLFLKALDELLEKFGLSNLDFTYVMTDFTDNNMAYWSEHPNFKPYLEKGLCDFAIYGIGHADHITLSQKQIQLTAGSVHNPIIVVANYIFDTVPHDVFKVDNGELLEGKLKLTTPADNLKDSHIKSLEKLHTEFSFSPVSADFYDDKALNDILHYYQKNLRKGTFLIPTGAINAINTLASFSQNKLFVISADKGYTNQHALEGLATPHIAFHGSFSMMVNFDALGRYFINRGGDSRLGSNNEGMKTNIFTLEGQFADMPNLSWAYDEYATRVSTKEFLLIKNEMIADIHALNPQQMLALLKFSFWDPDIFTSIVDALVKKVGQASRFYVAELSAGLDEILAKYYFIPNNKNVPFEVARTHHTLGNFDKAIDNYSLSQALFGNTGACLFNIGLCHYYKHDKETAQRYFKQCLEVEPNNSEAQEWLDYMSN